jgi:signal transduction histidine kinase
MIEELRNLRRMERIELTRTRRARDELFSALPGVVAMFDLNGNVEASTDMAKKYFGLRQGSHVSEAGMDWINDLVGRILKGEIEARPKDNSGIISHLIDGREHFFSPLAIPIPFNPDKQAEPEGVTLMLKDVTHACSVKDESGIEMVYKRIKPILTSLQMSIYMLLNEKAGEINERQIDLLISARDESDRIHAILTKLEDIERMESGSIQLDIQNISPGELLKESVEPFVTEARDKGVTLIVNPESIPDYVMADRSYIKSVFANILSNAVKFTMPGGSITVGARPEGRFIEFFIRDTGIGISEEKIASIFEPFSGISDGNDSGSTGLGLSLAREIVRAHGGEIRVKSAPGAGSTFYFTLRKSIQVKDQ